MRSLVASAAALLAVGGCRYGYDSLDLAELAREIDQSPSTPSAMGGTMNVGGATPTSAGASGLAGANGQGGWGCPAGTNSLHFKVTYRDFIGQGQTGGHPDFEPDNPDKSVKPGMVQPRLGEEGKPAFSPMQPAGSTLTTAENFDQWYREGELSITIFGDLLLNKQDNAFIVNDGSFFPLTGQGWQVSTTTASEFGGTAINTLTCEEPPILENYNFTTELRFSFRYQRGEVLSVGGDDDLWLFVGQDLVLDLGGIHPPAGTGNWCEHTDDQGTIEMDALGLEKGQDYEISLFHAERQGKGSSLALSLEGFQFQPSVCGTD